MTLLEELSPGGTATIIDVPWHGFISVELVYKDASNHLGSDLLYLVADDSNGGKPP